MKRIFVLIIMTVLAVMAAGCTIEIEAKGPCTYREDRTFTLSAADAKGVNVKGENGTVKVIGRPGSKEVRVTGTACAITESALGKIRIDTERSSDGWVRVIVDTPSGNNKVDLTVEVPDNLQVMARNDNGMVEVSHVYRGANVRGDNGTVSVSDVKGGVTVDSRNGAVTITQADGDVNVTRADNGILIVTDVKGDVTVTKQNGVVTVTNVAGDLTLTRKVNGLVSHNNVSGRVEIPR